MQEQRFEGFSPNLFRFFRDLSTNNNKDWFDQHRREYETEVLGCLKSFVADLGKFVMLLNPELETEPRVGRTISRIANDMRFHRNRPPYRPYMYISYPRRGRKWSDDALLYAGVASHGVSIGFYPGGGHNCPSQNGMVQDAIKGNSRLFQRYLDERRVAKKYWELADGENGGIKKWPLPKTASRWIGLDSFSVGEHFAFDDHVLSTRSFLDRAQSIVLDLYPLWLFATSNDPKRYLELYSENARALARPLTKSQRSSNGRGERRNSSRQTPARAARQQR
jgi:uncharacterized protein (DUF2461 family)